MERICDCMAKKDKITIILASLAIIALFITALLIVVINS